MSAEPSAVQTVQVPIDASSSRRDAFLACVLGDEEMGDEDLVDLRGRGGANWFQEMDAPRPQRTRIDVDISVPHDQAQARVAPSIEAGGRGERPVRACVVDAAGRRGQRGRRGHLEGPRLRAARRDRGFELGPPGTDLHGQRGIEAQTERDASGSFPGAQASAVQPQASPRWHRPAIVVSGRSPARFYLFDPRAAIVTSMFASGLFGPGAGTFNRRLFEPRIARSRR